MKILFKNARILKMNDEPIFISNLVVEGNRIAYIGEKYQGYAPFDREIDCNGNLLMPGFKNAHTHNAMTLFRSYADGLPLHEWLFDKIFPLEKKLVDDDVYWGTKLGILECLTSGVTACFDYYMNIPAEIKAFEDTGMRALILMALADTEENLIKYHEAQEKKNGLVKTCFGLHSVYTPSDEGFAMIKRLVYKYKLPFYTHASETEREVNECIEKRGKTPVKFLYDEGFFKYGGGIYHGCWLNEEDLKIIKDNNLFVVTNPGSNTKLASGVCDTTRLLNEGINLAIGTDGPSSNNALDMFREMYLVTGLQKLKYMDAVAMDAYEVLKMATVGGAKCMGLDDADILEVGKLADIIMIDLHRPNMQPLHDIAKNIVYSGSKENVKMTMIDGKILYENGEFFIGEDVENIYKKSQAAINDLAQR